MIRLIVFFMFVFSGMIRGQKPETIHVVTHNRVTIVTNPKTGEKSYPRWGIFPSGEISVRKILLHLTLGTPDSMKTAHWDYCDNIYIRRQGGKNGVSKDFEIARMLTPYGSIFGKGWQFEWTLDVTDFSLVLRDSVEIEYRHSGYEPDTVGWALTLDFEILRGPEVIKPIGITRLWKGNYPYGNPGVKIEDSLRPATIVTMPGSGISRIRIQHTGHGMDEPRGCSEFCSRWREIYYDDKMVQHKVLWKDCGSNPLYPQGGTWVYDRAGWCPGDLIQPDIVDLPSSAGKHVLSIKMEPYTATKNIQAVENICGYLVHCSKPFQRVDAAIGEIIVPSDHPVWKRLNPAGFNPRIVIQNLGSDDLTSIVIQYGTKGVERRSFEWTGKLPFNGSEEIILPGLIAASLGKNIFEVALVRPNGKHDGWESDNFMTSTYDSPITLPSTIVVKLKTNHHAHDNTLFLVNAGLDTVYIKHQQTLKADTIYTDTLRLEEGPHQFVLSDSAGDGLEFWAEPGQGNGYLRFLDLKGGLIHAFRSDCGNGEMLSFYVSRGFIKDTTVSLNAFSLYPRSIKDRTELEVISDRPAKMTVMITVDGKLTEKHEYEKIQSGTFVYNLGYISKGRIVLEALLDGKSCFKGRLFKEQ